MLGAALSCRVYQAAVAMMRQALEGVDGLCSSFPCGRGGVIAREILEAVEGG